MQWARIGKARAVFKTLQTLRVCFVNIDHNAVILIDFIMAKKNCFKRPKYATLTIHRACLQDAQAAAVEVDEHMLDFASKALARRSGPILRRRDRRRSRELAAQSVPAPVPTVS